MLGEIRGSGRVTFNVPAAAGTYAPEVLYCAPASTQRPTSPGGFDPIDTLSVLLEAVPPTSAQVEIDLLIGTDPADPASWYVNAATATLTGLHDALLLSGYRGARLRCKSGGTAGTLAVSASWRG